MAVKATFFRRFKGVILLVSSPSEGERHAAADKAFEMCSGEDLSLQEALEGTFGGVSDNAALQERIDELETHNHMLADEVRRLQEAGGERSTDAGAKAALRKIWALPQTRLGACFATVIMMFITATYWLPLKLSFLPVSGYLGEFYALGQLFFEWISAEDSRNGMGSVVLRSIIAISGVAASIYVFVSSSSLMVGTSGVILTAIIALSNAVPMLVNKLSSSEERPFKILRQWFA